MKVPKGKTVYHGKRVYKEGSELPDKVAKKLKLDKSEKPSKPEKPKASEK
jgi:hypothetical protein